MQQVQYQSVWLQSIKPARLIKKWNSLKKWKMNLPTSLTILWITLCQKWGMQMKRFRGRVLKPESYFFSTALKPHLMTCFNFSKIAWRNSTIPPKMTFFIFSQNWKWRLNHFPRFMGSLIATNPKANWANLLLAWILHRVKNYRNSFLAFWIWKKTFRRLWYWSKEMTFSIRSNNQLFQKHHTILTIHITPF